MTPVHHGRHIRPPTVHWLWRHHRWQIRPPAIQAKLCERDLKARTAWLVPVGPRIVRHFDLCLLGCVPENTLTAFRPKHCQGVLPVRDLSPCSRMRTAKNICRQGFLPRNADGRKVRVMVNLRRRNLLIINIDVYCSG